MLCSRLSKGVKKIVGTLHDRDEAMLLGCDKSPFVVSQFATLKKKRQQLLERSNRLYPTGGTDLSRCLKFALEQFQSKAHGARRALLVTDGGDTSFYNHADELAQEYAREKIRLLTVLIPVTDDAKKQIDATEKSFLGFAHATQGLVYASEDPLKVPQMMMDIWKHQRNGK